LIDLRVGRKTFTNGSKFDGVIGQFCKLAWGAHKKDPSAGKKDHFVFFIST